MGNLGELYYHQGNLARAAGCHEQALALARQAGRGDIEADQLGDLGNIACQRGDLAGAGVLLRQALAARRRLGDRRGNAIALENLAELAAAETKMERAGRLLGAAQALRTVAGTPQPVPERNATDQTRARVQAALGAAGFATAFSAGRDLPLEETMGEVLGERNVHGNGAGSLGHHDRVGSRPNGFGSTRTIRG